MVQEKLKQSLEIYLYHYRDVEELSAQEKHLCIVLCHDSRVKFRALQNCFYEALRSAAIYKVLRGICFLFET